MTLDLEQLIERLDQVIQQLKALESIFAAIVQEQKPQPLTDSKDETGATSNTNP